jgi:DAK2 domain fusion protein YloV
MTVADHFSLISTAAQALKDRKDEVNRLNVFPVPDGDTGTNMSLTMDVVLEEVSALPAGASVVDVCKAVTHGALMGARGNSGVILSQILRGLCEPVTNESPMDTEILAQAFERSVIVAFQAVRKPVEGTILTVLRDTCEAARAAADEGIALEAALPRVSAAAFESVRRTPDLLGVLKENGVVDAGGFGLAILIEGFVAAALNRSVHVADVAAPQGTLAVIPHDDWDDAEYKYCTEFLLFGDGLSIDDLTQFVASVGGSELVVGAGGEYKVHVHTDNPGAVLSHMTGLGEVADVHIHNMRRQALERDTLLATERPSGSQSQSPLKPVGYVAVAAGAGIQEIMRSLGVDEVVSGGQTMNPSTRELAEAIDRVPAGKVVVLPSNRNIILAANAAVSVAKRSAVVVPTTSVPQSFSAMLAADEDLDLEALAAEMTAAIEPVRSGEVTIAIKDAKSGAGPIKKGQVIGIADHEIVVVGDDVSDVALKLAESLLDGGRETLTMLAGEELTEHDAELLGEALAAQHPDVAIEVHRGDQPLYHVILSAE